MSHIWFYCFGCSKTLIIEADQFSEAISKAIDQGWYRRVFHKDISPWFCSYECGYESKAAIYCLENWRQSYIEYDNRKSLSFKILKFLGLK